MLKCIAPSWHEDVYLYISQLRTEWKEMEQTGEADDFVKGMGEASHDEWGKLVCELLERTLEKREIRNQ